MKLPPAPLGASSNSFYHIENTIPASGDNTIIIIENVNDSIDISVCRVTISSQAFSIFFLKLYPSHIIIYIKKATAHKVVSLVNGYLISHSSAKTRVAYLFSLIIPIYVGKQRHKKSPINTKFTGLFIYHFENSKLANTLS